MKRSVSFSPDRLLRQLLFRRELVVGILILGALLMFEVFNYSTTEYSLGDLLGEMEFMGIRWATILAVAFCGIDFAGVARLFTPEQGADEPREVWYLMTAWILAATMNAMLTWWAVSIAIISRPPSESVVLSRDTIVTVVPVFVAVLVWLIRVMIIGTFSTAGDHLLNGSRRRRTNPVSNRISSPGISSPAQPSFNALRQSGALRTASTLQVPRPGGQVGQSPAFRPVPKPAPQSLDNFSRPEPTYHPMSMSNGRNFNE